LALALVLGGCATQAPPTAEPGTWNGRAIGAPPAPNPATKQRMIAQALAEWEFFGRQTVVLRGAEESIPHVGHWEDDGHIHSSRVNTYWRAVGKPGLDGLDCREPWSAAFISYVMRGAGVPESQFRPAPAHWVYLSNIVDDAPYPGRWFVPRRPADYSPEPGDLICASRAGSYPKGANGYTDASLLNGATTHCDLVVAKNGQQLETVGGNVRNSVSKSDLELDAQGRLQSVPRRPWFLVLQNRL
jgi:hypothetical protein